MSACAEANPNRPPGWIAGSRVVAMLWSPTVTRHSTVARVGVFGAAATTLARMRNGPVIGAGSGRIAWRVLLANTNTLPAPSTPHPTSLSDGVSTARSHSLKLDVSSAVANVA